MASVHDKNSVGPCSYPFLSDEESRHYVMSSKLMVLTNKEDLLSCITEKYGDAAVICHEPKTSVADAKSACEADCHLVAVNISKGDGIDTHTSESDDLKPFTDLAMESNYIVTIIEPPKGFYPLYAGWHLNEADSCMLGLVAHSLLEECLQTVPEFCSDFRNFSHCETISEMVQFYELAVSNPNGMLHCTAKFLAKDSESAKEKYIATINSYISHLYTLNVIGLVFTPRTFGARLKLNSEQLKLWGGDDDDKSKSVEHHELGNGLTSEDFIRAEKNQSSCKLKLRPADYSTSDKDKKKSCRHYPNCQATLVCLSADDKPDFHPVTGKGKRAHMTIGTAPGESAVTTGTDLLQIVECEAQTRDWPTYSCVRGWLRDYGEGRWVLYLKKKVCVGSLFAGVYKPLNVQRD